MLKQLSDDFVVKTQICVVRMLEYPISNYEILLGRIKTPQKVVIIKVEVWGVIEAMAVAIIEEIGFPHFIPKASGSKDLDRKETVVRKIQLYLTCKVMAAIRLSIKAGEELTITITIMAKEGSTGDRIKVVNRRKSRIKMDFKRWRFLIKRLKAVCLDTNILILAPSVVI